MNVFQKFLSFKNIRLPSQSYFLGFLLTVSFALFYECAVPGMGEHQQDHSHGHSHDHYHANGHKHGRHDHHHSGDTHNHGEVNKHMHQMDVK